MSSGCLLNARLVVPLPTSPPTNETAAETLSPQPQVTPSGTVYISPPMQHLVSDNLIRRELPSTAPCFRKSSYSSALDARPTGTAPRCSSTQEIITKTDAAC